MQVTPEEKKAWAENLLRQKCTELGRMPTKKDFDSATCAQIKVHKNDVIVRSSRNQSR